MESGNDEMKFEDGFEESVSDGPKPTSSHKMEEEMVSESSDEDHDHEQLRADFVDHMEQRFLRGFSLLFFSSNYLISKANQL